MRYKDIKPEDPYVYKWHITDLDAFEFKLCHNCDSEVPLHKFSSDRQVMNLCNICASATHMSNKKDVIFAANMVLRALGAFDENEVIELPGQEE